MRHVGSDLGVTIHPSWNIGPKYGFLKELGYGAYARVCEAVEVRTGRIVAIKKFVGATCEQARARNCLREIELLTHLDHPNLVQAKDIFFSSARYDPSVYMVMDYLPIDLRKLIYSSESMDARCIKKVMYEILLATYYLHSANVVHRDMKPSNVLIGPNYKVMVCDLGLSCALSPAKSPKQTKDEEIPDELDEGAEMNPVTCGESRFVVGLSSHVKIFRPPGRGSRSSDRLWDIDAKVPKGCTARGKHHQKSTFATEVSPPCSCSIKTQLTSHIATRWYRAPEVILLERTYGPAVDMWGIGCIFAELLQTHPKSTQTAEERKPLFPGKTCFPLSPGAGQRESFTEDELKDDQMQAICNVLGTPSKEDLEFITDSHARNYMNVMKARNHETLASRFPYVSPHALELLTRMLAFNPSHRISAKEALGHPYFRDVRNPLREVEAESVHSLTEDG